jgi:hypothetical protein
LASNATKRAVDIELDEVTYLRAKALLANIPNGLQRAMVSAINKSVSKGRTTVIRGLADVVNVKRNNIAGRVDTEKATRDRPIGYIKILGRPIGLINFHAKDTRLRKRHGGEGVTAKIFKGGETVTYPHAFIGVGKADNKQVFERKRNLGIYRPKEPHYLPNTGRLMARIGSIRGVSLLDVYKQRPQLQKNATDLIRKDLATQVESQIDRLLKRKKSDR